MRKILIALAIVLIASCGKTKEAPKPVLPPVLPGEADFVFKNQNEGYSCYRIPAFIKAPNGDLLAFSEARKVNCDDFGDIDLVMKRSKDNGQTWEKLNMLVSNSTFKVGDPAPVVDYLDPAHPNGRIFLLYNTATEYSSATGGKKRIREAWYITSTDNGHTWSNPVNITASVHRPYAPDFNPQYNFNPAWTGVNTQGHGLQLKKGPKKGRIYIAGNHLGEKANADDFSTYRSYGYYSDDHGATWHIGGDIQTSGGNESTAVELSDGSIFQAVRYQILSSPGGQPADTKFKLVAISNSGGESWGASRFANDLPDPICQGNLLDVSYKGQHILLFSNPANSSSRTKMSISASVNDGQNWPYKYLVDSGPSAYSALCSINENEVGLIYEKGNTGGIVFKKISIAEVLAAK